MVEIDLKAIILLIVNKTQLLIIHKLKIDKDLQLLVHIVLITIRINTYKDLNLNNKI